MLILERESQNPDGSSDDSRARRRCARMSGCVWLGVSSSSCLTGVWWWVCVWLGLVKPPPRWHDSESTSGIRMCNHEEALNRKSGMIGLVCKYSKAKYIGGLVRARERQQVMRLDWLASLSHNTPYSGMPQIVDPNICTPSRCKNSTLLCLSICRFLWVGECTCVNIYRLCAWSQQCQKKICIRMVHPYICTPRCHWCFIQ